STSGVVDTKQQPGLTKRRQYSEALKRQMVAETQAPGASVSIVARRHDVNSNQLFRWRRQLLPKAVVESGAMVPVELAPDDGRSDGGQPRRADRPVSHCHRPTSSLGEQLALGVVDEDELNSALDWLAVRQPAIEAALAKRHFTGGTLVLYDVSSSYLEGRCCPLAQFGYSRDGKRRKRQIV